MQFITDWNRKLQTEPNSCISFEKVGQTEKLQKYSLLVLNIESHHQSPSDVLDGWVREEEGGSNNNDPGNSNELSAKKKEIVKAELLLLGEE